MDSPIHRIEPTTGAAGGVCSVLRPSGRFVVPSVNPFDSGNVPGRSADRPPASPSPRRKRRRHPTSGLDSVARGARPFGPFARCAATIVAFEARLLLSTPELRFAMIDERRGTGGLGRYFAIAIFSGRKNIVEAIDSMSTAERKQTNRRGQSIATVNA